jgi:hypothetical protein
MAWIRDFHQTLSYKLGFAHGLRNRQPFLSPWWADRMVYSLAFMDGLKARPAK